MNTKLEQAPVQQLHMHLLAELLGEIRSHVPAAFRLRELFHQLQESPRQGLPILDPNELDPAAPLWVQITKARLASLMLLPEQLDAARWFIGALECDSLPYPVVSHSLITHPTREESCVCAALIWGRRRSLGRRIVVLPVRFSTGLSVGVFLFVGRYDEPLWSGYSSRPVSELRRGVLWTLGLSR